VRSVIYVCVYIYIYIYIYIYDSRQRVKIRYAYPEGVVLPLLWLTRLICRPLTAGARFPS
jgi:hypothetical protein